MNQRAVRHRDPHRADVHFEVEPAEGDEASTTGVRANLYGGFHVLSVPSDLLSLTSKEVRALAPTITMTRKALEERRAAILSKLGMTLDEFAQVVETSTLTGEEWEALDQLEEVYFLLNEQPRWSRD